MQSASGQIWTFWNKVFNLSRGNVSAKAAAEELPDQNNSLSRKPHIYISYRFLLAVQVLVG